MTNEHDMKAVPKRAAVLPPGTDARVFDLTPILTTRPPSVRVRQATPTELAAAIAALHG